MAMHGFFDLETSVDLLRKLEREYDSWQQTPWDVDRAWNFFVTAEHLPDWLSQGKKRLPTGQILGDFKREDYRTRICSHLANGAKHFSPTDQRHTSVEGTGHEDDFVEDDFVEGGFIEEPALLVYLTPDERRALKQNDDSVYALWLAGEILAFWRQYFQEHAAS